MGRTFQKLSHLGVGWGDGGSKFFARKGGIKFNHIYSVCEKGKVSFITLRFSSKSS